MSRSFFQSMFDALFGKKPKAPKQPKAVKPIAFQRLVQVEHLPDYMQGHANLKGVYIGGCIGDPNGKWDGKHSAHAHIKGYDTGYICCKGERQFAKKTTMLHECSHLATMSGHTKKWATYYASLDVPKFLTYEWLKRKYRWKTKRKANAQLPATDGQQRS